MNQGWVVGYRVGEDGQYRQVTVVAFTAEEAISKLRANVPGGQDAIIRLVTSADEVIM